MTDDGGKVFRIEDADGIQVMSMAMGSSGEYDEEKRWFTASGNVFWQVDAPVTYDEKTRIFLAKLPGKAFPIEKRVEE
jgi:hypothetical protein